MMLSSLFTSRAAGLRPGLIFLLAAGMAGLLLAGCSGDAGLSPQTTEPDTVLRMPSGNVGDFQLEAQYSYIRSFPSSGGLYLVRLVPGEGFSGQVSLSVSADSKLNAELSRTILTADDPVVEVILRPSRQVLIQTYTLTVTATNSEHEYTIPLEVEIQLWTGGLPGVANNQRLDFIEWIETEYPELGPISENYVFCYLTYPQLIIVEHWTFLGPDYEIRVALHMTQPIDQWTYFRLRERNGWDPVLAAYRESDGPIYEIPIEEYPLLFGY